MVSSKILDTAKKGRDNFPRRSLPAAGYADSTRGLSPNQPRPTVLTPEGRQRKGVDQSDQEPRGGPVRVSEVKKARVGGGGGEGKAAVRRETT